MAAFIPQPQGMTFNTWGRLFAEQLAYLGVAAPKNDENWMTWGQELQNFPELVNLPDTYGFKNWEDWAVRVVEVNIN